MLPSSTAVYGVTHTRTRTRLQFDICDPVMHAKLLVALAAARCFPGGAWLAAQQASLARSLGSEAPGSLDLETAGSVRAAYASWQVRLFVAVEAYERRTRHGR